MGEILHNHSTGVLALPGYALRTCQQSSSGAARPWISTCTLDKTIHEVGSRPPKFSEHENTINSRFGERRVSSTGSVRRNYAVLERSCTPVYFGKGTASTYPAEMILWISSVRMKDHVRVISVADASRQPPRQNAPSLHEMILQWENNNQVIAVFQEKKLENYRSNSQFFAICWF